MNIKILSLSSLLIIASCITGIAQSSQRLLDKQDKAFLQNELRQAEKDYKKAYLAKVKINKNRMDVHRERFQKFIEYENCLRSGNAYLDCKVARNTYNTSVKAYVESAYYKNKVIPAEEEELYHISKVIQIRFILTEEDPRSIEDVIKLFEKNSKDNSDPEDISGVNFAKVYDQIAQYFRSLPGKMNAAKLAAKIENTMPEYY